VLAALLIGGTLIPWTPVSTAGPVAALEQRIDITIRNYEFQLNQPSSIRLHTPTFIILRNQDIVRHGFASPMLMHMLVQGEGEGVAAYGKGIEGFYVDAGKTLVIRFVPERAGNYSFKCDLHPQMKGELYLLEVPAA
jgi:hypothetical protein